MAVLDLTTMWAGPLCTHLLAEWGAQVTTVEPAIRPDGLRGSPGQFAAFAQGKRRVPWDLREREDRLAFEEAVRQADVLVESFSDRVLPNLGYPTDELWRLNPTTSRDLDSRVPRSRRGSPSVGASTPPAGWGSWPGRRRRPCSPTPTRSPR